MKVTGIIAEYDPFHNGHRYQLERAVEMSGADAVVVVMSGSFTQRGTPAFYDKMARTHAALMNGADLIIELPYIYACNAEVNLHAAASESLSGWASLRIWHSEVSAEIWISLQRSPPSPQRCRMKLLLSASFAG